MGMEATPGAVDRYVGCAAPLATFFVQIATFVASFSDRQQQKQKLKFGK